MPRPKGRKNNATLLREATEKKLLHKATGILQSRLPDVANAVLQKACEGDLTAAKLVFQYTLTTPDARDAMKKGSGAIQINIVSATPEVAIDALDVAGEAEHPAINNRRSPNAIDSQESTPDSERRLSANGQHAEIEEGR